MKIVLAILCLVAIPTIAQFDPTLLPPDVIERAQAFMKAQAEIRSRVSANYILREGDKLTLRGEVEIRTTTVTVRANSAVLNTATGEIQASGDVRIFPVSLESK